MRNPKYYLAASIAFITFAFYLPALHNGFTVWDDDLYVVANVHIRSLNLDLLKWSFFDFYAGYWSPITWISHALDIAAWGFNPLGHHLTSIVIHAANTFIVVILILKLFDIRDRSVKKETQAAPFAARTKLITAGATGLLFGLHPLHVESVVWVSERKDLLCALFFLLSIITYTNHVSVAMNASQKKKSRINLLNKHYLLSAFFFLLALMSKPMAVSLPAVLIILDWYPFNRIGSFKALLSSMIEKIPFFAFSFISSVLTILAAKTQGALTPMELTTLASRLLVGGGSLLMYIGKMLWPLNLLPFYAYPKNVSIVSPEYFSVTFFVVAITAACIAIAKRQKLWLAIWGYYIVTLMPVLGIVRVGLQSMADRFTYLPSIGPFLVIGLAVAWVEKRASVPSGARKVMKPLAVSVAFAILIILSYLTVIQISLWENDIKLWSYAIDRDPEGAVVCYNNRGTAYGKMGQFEKALKDLDKAIMLYPDYSDAYSNRGIVYSKVGLLDNAIQSFNKALALKPNAIDLYSNRGVAYAMIGQYDKALEDYTRAIELNQDYAIAYYNRGKLFNYTGKQERALADFQKACDLGYENACRMLQN